MFVVYFHNLLSLYFYKYQNLLKTKYKLITKYYIYNWIVFCVFKNKYMVFYKHLDGFFEICLTTATRTVRP